MTTAACAAHKCKDAVSKSGKPSGPDHVICSFAGLQECFSDYTRMPKCRRRPTFNSKDIDPLRKVSSKEKQNIANRLNWYANGKQKGKRVLEIRSLGWVSNSAYIFKRTTVSEPKRLDNPMTFNNQRTFRAMTSPLFFCSKCRYARSLYFV